jgi:putative NADPH-quinone reductase
MLGTATGSRWWWPMPAIINGWIDRVLEQWLGPIAPIHRSQRHGLR